MRKPLEDMMIFSRRRTRLAEKIKGSVLIVAATPEYIRNGTSVHHSYRANSSLYYLTGFEEPEAIFVFRPGQTPETVMFVRPKDMTRETWDGFRYGPEGAQSAYQMEKAYPIEEFDKQIVGLLKGADRLYYSMYKNPAMDEKIKNALQSLKTSMGRSGMGLLPVEDSDECIGELRLIKNDDDIKNMRKACELTAEAHLEIMKHIRPGQNERELHGLFISEIMKRGAAREGYGGIFAGGGSSCTLHYVFNDQTLKAGDIFLIDAAGEYNYFTADITRTYPVNGKFTDEQAEVYEGVLKVQKHFIDKIKPGLSLVEMNEEADDLLTDLMLELGLLTGRKQDIMQAKEHKKYYPHNLGHYLGMDVHDMGLYRDKQGQPRRLEPGMTFTVEPGLYIPPEDKNAAAAYRGIGVRIEDNILVTNTGCEVLTRKCPKELADLERIVGKA